MPQTYLVVDNTLIRCSDSATKPYIKVKNAYLELTTQTRTDGYKVKGTNDKIYQIIEKKVSMYTTTMSSGATTISTTTSSYYTK